jgi:uncharacterized damage-inducible protein DinB
MKAHFLRMAEYNRWSLERLFEKLELINDENYHADAGLFFRSIHGTLVHLLLASELWFSRVTGQAPNNKFPHTLSSYWGKEGEVWEQAVEGRKQIQEQLLSDANIWIEYIKTVEEDKFGRVFEYSSTHGVPTRRQLDACLDHIFNHGTHHRGQITAAMTRFGGEKASPTIDLLYML